VEFIGGLGIGALLLAGLERWLRRRDELNDRRYRELREAYAGLLKALNAPLVDTAVLGDTALLERNADFRYWVNRALLVCPNDAIESLQKIEARGIQASRVHRDALILSMRRDLESIK